MFSISKHKEIKDIINSPSYLVYIVVYALIYHTKWSYTMFIDKNYFYVVCYTMLSGLMLKGNCLHSFKILRIVLTL